ncbi:carbohydrate ABC transporter permease [Candidatus Bipolaricaulota bacterium]|nr:carbohydrate ABC transporter permease [Candidatus Bipolaricaulota bacterium]
MFNYSQIRKIGLYAILMMLAVFFTFPFFWAVSTSFKGRGENIYSATPHWIPRQPTLNNYVRLFQEVPILKYFFNSVLITVMGVAVDVLLAALAAYALGRFDFWGKPIITAVIIAPLMIPVQGTIVVNYLTIKGMGLVNTYIAVVLPYSVYIIGIFILREAFAKVPNSLEESARMDGAGELRIWWQIMLPIVRPQLAAISILAFVRFWNFFMWPLIILKDEAKYPLPVGLTALEASFQQDFRVIAAGTIVSVIPILIFFFFTQQFFVEGTQGAIKG